MPMSTGQDQDLEGRPHRMVKKPINYGIFHEVGRTDLDLSDSEQDAEVDAEL